MNAITKRTDGRMHALRVHSYEAGSVPSMDELPMPVCAADEVRVRVLAVGVSLVDLLVVSGSYQIRKDPPFTGGTEFSGVVDAAGEADNAGLCVGDLVCGTRQGAWAQVLCMPGHLLQKLPEKASAVEAAVLMAPYATALYALKERAHLRAGETLLVLGATGSVGHAAVQLGAHLGALVIAVASGPRKADAARQAGANHVVDGSGAWKHEVKALAGPSGVNVVFDTVGGDATDAAFRTLGWNGRHLMVGFAGGQIGLLKTNLAILKGASLIGVDLREAAQREPHTVAAVKDQVVELYREGRICPLIHTCLSAQRFAEARTLVQDRATIGRVVMDFETIAAAS